MQGDKVTARIGGNLNIETLQEKETYEEQNTSAGFGISWNVNMTKAEVPGPNGTSKTVTTRSFAKPNIGGSFSKGNISSHYRSARDQAGIFAGIGGFDLLVGKNTDLKGALIVSKATADKNKLSTGTLSFSDLENEADYHAKDSGSTAQIKPTLRRIKETGPAPNKSTEKLKIVQGLSISPTIPTEVQGSASSTTKSAVAPGTIDIRENPTQDISPLSRDTENALNELGRIFDKKSVEEQKELVNVFREEAFRLAHNLPDDGSGRKVLIHTFIGGLISQLSGAGFASGATGAGLNEALINNLKGLDPVLAQGISALIGAAAAKAVNGNAAVGASAAAAGTKYNFLIAALPLVLSDYILVIAGLSGYVVLSTDDGQQFLMNATGKIIAKCNNLGEWMVSNGEEAFDYIGDTVEDIIYWVSTGTPRNNKAQNEQARSAANKHGLNREQRRKLHDEISGQNYGYKEIDETARRIKNGEL